MKEKLVALLIPALVIPAIIGTGFSVFQFIEGNSSSSLTVTGENIQLEIMAENGSASLETTDLPRVVFTSTNVELGGDLLFQYTPGTNWEGRRMWISLDVTVSFVQADGMDTYISVQNYAYDSEQSLYRNTIAQAFVAENTPVSYTFSSWPNMSYRPGLQPVTTQAVVDLKNAIENETLLVSFSLYLGEEAIANVEI